MKYSSVSACWMFVAVVWLVLVPLRGSAQDRPPNVLFLLSDDQRTDSIGAYGNSLGATPHLDGLAAQSTNFRNAYCAGSAHGAVCAPSRAMIFSGRHYLNIPENLEGVMTIGEALGGQNYTTFATGKWHNGRQSLARNFQRGRHVFLGGMSDHEKVPICELDGGEFTEITTGDRFSSELFADAAIEFLQSCDKQRPFFCYVSFTAPHDPRMPPEPFRSQFDWQSLSLPANFLPQHPFDTAQMAIRDEVLAGWPREPDIIRQQLAEYYGMIAHLDAQIGRIFEALDDCGSSENTVVIFASDHGLAMGSHGLLGKQSLYEHSMKAPLMVSLPGQQQRRDVDSLVYLSDLAPTIAELAGADWQGSDESRSLVPLLTGEDPSPRRYLGLSYGKLIRSVRDDRWKLIRWPQVDVTQLFDLQTDPDERVNLADSEEHALHRERLFEALSEWQRSIGDEQPLFVENPSPAAIDLTGRERKPDQHQPDWIVDKYFGGRR